LLLLLLLLWVLLLLLSLFGYLAGQCFLACAPPHTRVHVVARYHMRAQVPNLTRAEWSVVRGAMGRPRRLSRHFLLQERHKLQRYRLDIRLVQAGKVRSAAATITVDLVVTQRGWPCHCSAAETGAQYQ
jgi:hypothetical protein